MPFTTQELFQTGEALCYGVNALSNNFIMCDRKKLKNPKGIVKEREYFKTEDIGWLAQKKEWKG